MKHIIFFLFFTLLAGTASAQLVHAKRFWTETWYIDGQKKDVREVRLHLDKANNEAYRQFRGAENAEVAELAFSIVSIAGLGWIIGAQASGSDNTLGGWGIVLLGTTGGLISSSIRNSKYDRAVEVYNLSLTPPPPTRK